MNVFAMLLFTGAGVFVLVFAGRAISGARFNRALRAYVLPSDRRPFIASVDAETRTTDDRRSA